MTETQPERQKVRILYVSIPISPRTLQSPAISQPDDRFNVSPSVSIPAALFGSVARGEAREESDVDVYVEFEAGFHPGLGWFDLEEELERLLGRRVDLEPQVALETARPP